MERSPNRLQFPADTAADPSPPPTPSAAPSPPGLMENVVPGPGQAGWTVCLCVWRGQNPEASRAPSGSPGVSSSLQALGLPGLGLVACWGSPLAPPSPWWYPHALPTAPSPCSDPRRVACPFKSGPADITAGGGWPGSRLRGGCRTRLRSAPSCCSRDPGPGRPLPPPPAAQTPGSAPGLARAPVLLGGAPGLPLLSLLLRVSLSPSSLSLCLFPWLKVSGSQHLQAQGLRAASCLFRSVSLTSPLAEPQNL